VVDGRLLLQAPLLLHDVNKSGGALPLSGGGGASIHARTEFRSGSTSTLPEGVQALGTVGRWRMR
jgi:hypothetical protein